MICENTQQARDSRTSVPPESTDDKKPLRFESCIGCPDIGPKCLGPNLAMLPISELRIWVKRWKEYFHLTVDQCAAIWETPVGTVSRFLATAETDFKYMTVQNIVRGIIGYGQPAGFQLSDNPCPATTAKIQEQISQYEQQLAEKTEECSQLTAAKLNRANEYTERMAEQREYYEKHLSEKTDTILYLRQLAEKRQKDLEKSEAVSKNYLDRIDVKNQQIAERDAEIRQLNAEIRQMSSAHNADSRELIDRLLRMSDLHAAEIRAITQKN